MTISCQWKILFAKFESHLYVSVKYFRSISLSSQQTLGIHPILFQCWASVKELLYKKWKKHINITIVDQCSRGYISTTPELCRHCYHVNRESIFLVFMSILKWPKTNYLEHLKHRRLIVSQEGRFRCYQVAVYEVTIILHCPLQSYWFHVLLYIILYIVSIFRLCLFCNIQGQLLR